MAGALVDEEERVEGPTNGTSGTKTDVAVVEIPSGGRERRGGRDAIGGAKGGNLTWIEGWISIEVLDVDGGFGGKLESLEDFGRAQKTDTPHETVVSELDDLWRVGWDMGPGWGGRSGWRRRGRIWRWPRDRWS